MQKWEYLYLRITSQATEEKISDKTNEKGDEGWELVTAIQDSDIYSSFVLIFKRPKK